VADADYMFAIEDNQPSRHAEIESSFCSAPAG
jgi:hypothetical protein